MGGCILIRHKYEIDSNVYIMLERLGFIFQPAKRRLPEEEELDPILYDLFAPCREDASASPR